MSQFEDYIKLLIYTKSINCNKARLNMFVNFLNSNSDFPYFIYNLKTKTKQLPNTLAQSYKCSYGQL